MRKAPKPWRRKKGRKEVGNWFVTPFATDGNQKPVNLGTKNANKAGERAREYAATGKRNFQDDLDGAAESTIAAVEGAAGNPPVATGAAPIVEQPAARVVAAPAAAPVSPAVPLPPAAAPAAPPVPEASGAAASPEPASADWRDDAKAAAEEARAEADHEERPEIAAEMALSPEELDGLYNTAASLIVEGQLWAQSWIVKRRTGEAPPPIAQIAAAVKSAQPKMGELLEKSPDNAVSMWRKQLRLWVPLDMLPLWAGASISIASLLPVQLAAGAGIAAQKKRAKNGSPVVAPPAPPPPAAPIADADIIDNGAGAAAL